MSTIKNIIFDLCGPIITIDVGLIDKQLQHLGVKDEQPYRKLYDLGLTKRFESNQITTAQFCNELRSILATDISDKQICNAWNTLIVSFPRKHVDFLNSIKGKYRLFLLSNCDEVNAQYFAKELKRYGCYDAFERVYFSHELGMRKPDPAIFKYIIDNHQLNPSETLFVDDCLKHIDSAKTLGIQTCFMPAENDISEMLI